MIVDCSTCVVRGHGCAGCVVTVLFGEVPEADLPWHAPGRPTDDVDHAIGVLAAAGMLGPDHVPVGLVPVATRGAATSTRRAV